MSQFPPAVKSFLHPISAGMGGATGSGVAPLVADIAKRAGFFAVGVEIPLFVFEGAQWITNALSGADAFRQIIGTVFTLGNDQLLQNANEGIVQQINATFLLPVLHHQPVVQ